MAAAWFHRAGVQRLFLSLGDQGIFYSDGACQGHLPVLGSPVVNVTGGGDAFMAGLTHAWLLEQGIMEATRVRPRLRRPHRQLFRYRLFRPIQGRR